KASLMLEILSRRFFLKLNISDHRSILTDLQGTLKGNWRYLIPAKPPIHNHMLIPNYQDFKIQDFRYSDGFECFQAIKIGRQGTLKGNWRYLIPAKPPIHNHMLIPNYQDFKIQDFRYSDGFECFQAIKIGRNGKNKLAYAPKLKIPHLPKREDPAKDLVYHQCGDIGHWKRTCPQYLAELLKNKMLSQGASGPKGSRKLKPGALSLYVGNGQRATVKAIGSYHLSLPSGLVIVLNNCHYAPYITRGIISVSHLYDDGYVNQFMDNLIQVSRNNMVYFSAVPRDGIFEIDLSDYYTNVSSIYALSNKRSKSNMDSALWWHCRIGHISKKRIEKLQHDDFSIQLTLRLLKNTFLVCL
nr:hypothetical protein [Tanacetum cinerariifolium]